MEKFVEYCKNYILENIDSFEGNSYYGCDFSHILTDGANCDGSLTYSTSAAIDYIREWWGEAAAYWDYEKDNFGENMHNPFDNPEAYMVCMVIEGVSSILSDAPFIKEGWNDEVEFTAEVIQAIKEYVEQFDEDAQLF